MTNFAITGLADYVAPRHLRAMAETGGRLVAAVDPHASVGVLDGYFPDTAFFTEPDRFARHLEAARHGPDRVDVLPVCSPNHFHDAHARLGLRVGADVLFEKPLVLTPWALDALKSLEAASAGRVWWSSNSASTPRSSR